jgi:hypothetical protein
MEEVAQCEPSYVILLLKYYQPDQIRENEVSGTCGTHGRGEESVQGFVGKDRRKRTS